MTDAQGNPLIREKKEELEDVLNHDSYFASMISNERTARSFFDLFLRDEIKEEIDLSTLKAVFTRDVDPQGKETIGDLYFTAETRARLGKKSRRAVFVIILEHKSANSDSIPVQFLKYISSFYVRMIGNRSDYVDESGLLPCPYPMLFSQESRPEQKPLTLEQISWKIDSVPNYLPNFEYHTINICDFPLEKIRQCDPIMRVFLYLERIAKQKVDENENEELTEAFKALLRAKEPDERLRLCLIASFSYMKYLRKKRPNMMTVKELKNEVRKEKGEKMNSAVLEFFEEEFTAARNEGVSEGISQGISKGKFSSVDSMISRGLKLKYGDSGDAEKLKEKIEEINYYPALEDIQIAIWQTNSLKELSRKIDEIVRQYEDEISENS